MQGRDINEIKHFPTWIKKKYVLPLKNNVHKAREKKHNAF